MPSRDELEQDLLIVEAERDAAQKRAYELEKENASLRGQTALMLQRAPELGEIDTDDLNSALHERAELEVLKVGIDADLEALNEMRSPSGALLKQAPPENAIDIVRANQRERAELQERSQKANILLSRIAALAKLDRWDEDGGEKLLGRLQAVSTVHLKLNAALKQAKRDLTATPELDASSAAHLENACRRSFLSGAIQALEKAVALPIEKPPADLNAPRRIVFVVGGHEIVMTAKPDDTVDYLRQCALEIAYPSGTHPLPHEQWLIFDESGKPLPVNKVMRDVPLPTDRVVITAPAGVGG